MKNNRLTSQLGGLGLGDVTGNVSDDAAVQSAREAKTSGKKARTSKERGLTGFYLPPGMKTEIDIVAARTRQTKSALIQMAWNAFTENNPELCSDLVGNRRKEDWDDEK